MSAQPTPWKVKRIGRSEVPDDWYVEDANGREVAVDLEEDDARLIGAAPALYEALKDILPRFESALRFIGNDEDIIAIAAEKARSALASALPEKQK